MKTGPLNHRPEGVSSPCGSIQRVFIGGVDHQAFLGTSAGSASLPFAPGLLIALPQSPRGKSPVGDDGQEDSAQEGPHGAIYCLLTPGSTHSTAHRLHHGSVP